MDKNPLFRVANKLKFVKVRLNQLNKESFGQVDEEKVMREEMC